MAAKKGGRLDQDSLEKALQEAFNDQQPEASISGNAADEPSGLKAPQCTKLLNAQELAQLGLEDEDVVTDRIDVDSRLVTELNKKLSDQAAPGAASSSSAPKRDDFSANLSSALGKLSDVEADENNFEAALQKRLSLMEMNDNDRVDDNTEAPSSGLRAPQPTVKLSAEALASLGDDDDEADQSLVAQLQMKLGAQDIRESAARSAGLLAPANTLMFNDQDEERTVQRGGRAPKTNAKLVEDQLAGILDDDDGVCPTYSPAVLGDSSGLRAPEPTKLITADMLAGLDDEDDIPDMDMPQGAPALSQPAAQPGTEKGVGFDVNFADSLQKKLQIQGGAAEDFASPDDEVQCRSLFMSGLKAPQTTQNITAAQLALLEDDDDIPDMCALGHPVVAAFDQSMPSPEQLATLTAAAMALQEVSPALEQFRPTSPGMALTMDSVSATKVIQTAREWPEGIDLWGQPKPLTSSCKQRLAWLSKDEIGKENEKLRKEINSLRAEIDMHRKEATLARKV